MDLSILTAREIDWPFLAVEVAIDLDNLARSKISELEPERVEKLKDWLLAAEEIYGKDENFYSGYLDPGTAVALNVLLADFFQRPKCQRFSELGERIRSAIELFVYSNKDEIGRLKDFCLKMSRMFLELEARNRPGPCRLAA